MKLYTEEQIRVAYNFGFCDGSNDFGKKEVESINFLTPIELPSDEEIEEQIPKRLFGLEKEGFELGAKWMKEQILNQNK